MTSGLPILVVCYLAAFLLEAARFKVRSPWRRPAMVATAGVGLLAHSVVLASRAQVGQTPLSSEFDWCLLAAWLLMAVFFYLFYYHPENPIGLFVLPLVLGLLAIAAFWASSEPFTRPEGTRFWGLTHGLCLTFATVAGMVGFVSGIMYLWHARRLRQKLPPQYGFRLPSLEWLQKVNERSIVITTATVLGGFVSGLVLSWIKHGAIWWTDWVVWTTTVLMAWMIAACIFNALYRPARQGRKVAYLTLATFVFLLTSLVAFVSTPQHAGPQATPAAPAVPPPPQAGRSA